MWYKYEKRNNPAAEEKMIAILRLWRQLERQTIHVKYESVEPNSTYRPSQVGCEFKECVHPIDGERIVIKYVHSVFIGTDLEATLRLTTYLVEDATFTFAKPDYRGCIRTAEEVHSMSLANLEYEYCKVICTDELIKII